MRSASCLIALTALTLVGGCATVGEGEKVPTSPSEPQSRPVDAGESQGTSPAEGTRHLTSLGLPVGRARNPDALDLLESNLRPIESIPVPVRR